MMNLESDIDLLGNKCSLQDARKHLDWLQDPRGVYFWRWLLSECESARDKSLSEITDNPIKDILVQNRSIGKEKFLRSILGYTKEVNQILKDAEERQKKENT